MLAGRRASHAYIHHIVSYLHALKIAAKRPNTDLLRWHRFKTVLRQNLSTVLNRCHRCKSALRFHSAPGHSPIEGDLFDSAMHESLVILLMHLRVTPCPHPACSTASPSFSAHSCCSWWNRWPPSNSFPSWAAPPRSGSPAWSFSRSRCCSAICMPIGLRAAAPPAGGSMFTSSHSPPRSFCLARRESSPPP